MQPVETPIPIPIPTPIPTPIFKYQLGDDILAYDEDHGVIIGKDIQLSKLGSNRYYVRYPDGAEYIIFEENLSKGEPKRLARKER